MANGEDRYAVVLRRVWDDATFVTWGPPGEPCAQFLWLYLLTTPTAGSVPGLFRFSVAEVAERFGWSLEGTAACLARIVASGRAEYDGAARLLYLPNGLPLNAPKNGNVVKSWRRQWRELPECALKAKAAEAFGAFVSKLGDGFAAAWTSVISSGFAETRNGSPNKLETKSKQFAKQPRNSSPNSSPNNLETVRQTNTKQYGESDDQINRRTDDQQLAGPAAGSTDELGWLIDDIADCPFMAGVNAAELAHAWGAMAKRKHRSVEDLEQAASYTLDAVQRGGMSKKGIAEPGPYATSTLAMMLDAGGLEGEHARRQERTKAPGEPGDDFAANEVAEMERAVGKANRKGSEASAGDLFGNLSRKGAA